MVYGFGFGMLTWLVNVCLGLVVGDYGCWLICFAGCLVCRLSCMGSWFGWLRIMVMLIW